MSQNLLTESECIQVVCNAFNINESKNVEIKDFVLVALSDDTLGFLGEYFKLSINVIIDNGKPQNLSLFVKSIPITNEFQKSEVYELGVFRKEIFLYGKLFKEMNPFVKDKWHPDCYYIRDDVIVLEDLISHNYEHISPNDFTQFHLEAGLKCLASMHATSFLYEAKTGIKLENFANVLHEPQVKRTDVWFNVGIANIRDLALIHPKYQTMEYQKFIMEKLIPSFEPIYEMVKPSKTFHNALCHRDVWRNNIFFKKDINKTEKTESIILSQSECIFVDFQLTNYHPPVLDVLFFVYMTIQSRKERDETLEWCFKCYYQNVERFLEGHGDFRIEDILSWTELRQSCDTFKLFILVIASIYVPIILLPSSFIHALKKEDPDKYGYFISVSRSELCLDWMEKNVEYKGKVLETIEELVDYVFAKEANESDEL